MTEKRCASIVASIAGAYPLATACGLIKASVTGIPHSKRENQY